MRRVRKFLALSAHDRWLLLRVAATLATIQLGLRLMRFPQLLRLLGRFSARHRAPSRPWQESPRLVWAIAAAARALPTHPTCLVQALAGQLLLRRRGCDASLCIGVARDGTGRLEAHAWLESDGAVLIGGPRSRLERYRSLPAFEAL